MKLRTYWKRWKGNLRHSVGDARLKVTVDQTKIEDALTRFRLIVADTGELSPAFYARIKHIKNLHNKKHSSSIFKLKKVLLSHLHADAKLVVESVKKLLET